MLGTPFTPSADPRALGTPPGVWGRLRPHRHKDGPGFGAACGPIVNHCASAAHFATQSVYAVRFSLSMPLSASQERPSTQPA